MLIKMLKSKIHRASVTDANLEYDGSISIDEKLMHAAKLYEYEKVHVLDITNGARVETYVITAPCNSNKICINGAAAHLIKPNDTIIILSYCLINADLNSSHLPTIVKVNKQNVIIK